MTGVSSRGLGKLDVRDFVQIKIEGRGSFVVPKATAAVVAKVCEDAADEIGLTVPVYLTGCYGNFITCIKFVRQITGKNLKDAKAIVDMVRGEYPRRQLLGFFRWDKAQAIKLDADEHNTKIEVPHPLEILAQQAE